MIKFFVADWLLKSMNKKLL